MSVFDILNFYNQGARVVVRAAPSSGNMSRTFTAKKGNAASVDKYFGYDPKPASKLAKGAAYDVLEYMGSEYLLLKGGYVYDVTISKKGSVRKDVISAEQGHLTLPLPAGVEVDVDEHDPHAVKDEGTLGAEEGAGASDDGEE